MAIRPFIPYPDKRLRMVAAPVETVDETVKTIWQDMLDTMYAMPGVGLAAVQIGIMKRLAVVDCSGGDKSAAICMADPILISQSEEFAVELEGSPNLPGVNAKIKRPKEVTVTYLDEAGMRVRKTFEGLWAVSAQHQLDHLEGGLYFDHLSSVKRKMLLAKAAKYSKKQAG